MKPKLVFINSHPIQYFSPLYKRLNELGVQTECWYCSNPSDNSIVDKQFGLLVKWDIPLLEGYEYTFFKNYSPNKSHFGGFFGLINFGVIKRLFSTPKSIIIVHGWHYFTHLATLMLARIAGHRICLRSETAYVHEVKKTGFVQRIKRFFLKNIIFPRVDNFLYIGTQNRKFYEDLGVPPSKLIFCPYSVDNSRFTETYNGIVHNKSGIKESLGIPAQSKVILFSGKYIQKKRPLDLLRAYAQLNSENLWVIFVGEGELRGEMEAYIKQNNLSRVILTGFINQSIIPQYYAISDVFVMCSEVGETWGLAVNEAMNFDIPVIISDLTGSSYDLVNEGGNGFTYKTGNIDELVSRLRLILTPGTLSSNPSSREIIREYSYDRIAANLSQLREEESR